MASPCLALLLALIGLVAVAAATAGDPLPPLESIPLRAAAVATPIRLPTTPPIRSTPLFTPIHGRVSLLPWHKRTLMRWYMPPQPTPDMGMT